MTLNEVVLRLKMPMNRAWKKIQRFCITIAIIVPTSAELGEYFGFFPEGAIPIWVKQVIGVIITLGILIPKFTVNNNDELNKRIKRVEDKDKE